jgi:biopolymer transport protein ExbD
LSIKVDSDANDSEIVAEINITPLTDIFLVLLIIFMVTTSAMTQSALQVSLPETSKSSAASSVEQGVILTLAKDGSFYVNNRLVASKHLQELRKVLQDAFSKTKSRVLILEADKQALLGSAIHVMDIAKQAGATQFAISTSQEALK